MTGLKTLVNLPEFKKEKEFLFLKLEQPDAPLLKFRYSIDKGLEFYSNKYKGYVQVYHSYDNGIYSDAKEYISGLNFDDIKVKNWFSKLQDAFKEELKKL